MRPDSRTRAERSAPGPPDGHSHDLARDCGFLPGQQVCDRPLRYGALVAVRPVLEQVAHTAEAELGELLLQGRADP